MANRSTDIRSRANDAVHELGEIDALVHDLEDEIDGAAADIARATEPVVDAEDGAEADPIAEAAEELDDEVVVNAETVDEALEKVAAEIQADLDDSVETGSDQAAPVEESQAPFDDNAGEDSIAAQIDEELARALDERDDDAEPVARASAPKKAEEAALSDDGAQDGPKEDDGVPADAQATDEAVHALAEALDRLLEDDEVAEPTGDAEDKQDDDAEPEAAPPAPPATAPKPAPAAKPAPKPAPARAPMVDTKTEQPESLSLKSVLISVLVLANKPFESLPPQVRETLGLAGLVTIFNAACLWVFLLLR
jgi:hypothetical protein